MARGKPICEEIRNLIINYHKSGESFGKIAETLQLNKSSVFSIVKYWKRNGSIDCKIDKKGRKSKITNRDKRALAAIVKADRRQSLRNAAAEWSKKLGEM